MNEYEDIFAKSKDDIGRTDIIKHKIRLTTNVPISQRPYTITDSNKKKKLKEELERMEKLGVIRKSMSPWASPITLVQKPNGGIRKCGDYRKVNNVTITHAYPIPKMNEELEKYRAAKYYTSLDAILGFWQVEMEEEDKEIIAFTTQFGLYEYNVMSFGLKNAPATFQMLMNEVLRGYLDEFATVYIDDILIYSRTFKGHLEYIRKVLERLRKAKIKIKVEKCKFCESEIKYLGHIVGRNGLRPDPAKIEKIKNIKRPVKVKELRALLGLFNYYKKFVDGYSKIARPLYKLLRKDQKFIWTEKQEKSVNKLKKKLTEAPILQYPNFEKQFIIFTDASKKGLGAVLSQLDDEKRERVIIYDSRSLIPAEKNYATTDLECLAVIWAVQKFHKYLFSSIPFKIVTDHSALKTLKTAKIPKGRRARWIMELQQYDFTIEHRSGKKNANADALFRLKYKKDEK